MNDSPVHQGASPLLEIHALSKRFDRARRGMRAGNASLLAVDDVSFTIHRGEIFGLAGESGSGKSTLGRTLVRLLEPTGGAIYLDGQDLASARGSALRSARRRIQIIFQDPATALSPRRTIGQSLTEPLRHFEIGERTDHARRVNEALAMVGLDSSALERYPHQFSSGQRQRISIARALICEPDLVIADEAVAALDVSIQAQIIALLKSLRERHGVAILFISHDLAVIRQLADTVGIMYRGRLAECGPADRVFHTPAHPYTRQLLAAVPGFTPTSGHDPTLRAKLSGGEPVEGCAFRARCPKAMEQCASEHPRQRSLPEDRRHRVECHLYEPDGESTDRHDG